MHILHVIDSLARGGAERALVEIANRSATDGHKVSVCITRSNSDLEADLHSEIRLTVLDRRRRFDWKGIQRFSSLVRSDPVDLLHVYGRSTLAFVAFVKTLRLVPAKIPVVFSDQYGIHLDPSIPFWFRIWAKNKIDFYVGVYDKLGKWAADAGIPQTRIGVIDNALDVSRIRDAEKADVRQIFGIPDDTPVGIVVGGIRREKAIDILLKAIRMSALGHIAKFLVVGGERDPIYARQCRGEQQRLGLNNTVVLAGERADVPSLLKGCDFAVLPSRSEGSPNVLIEYMFAGLPFVATTVGGIAPRLTGLGIPEFVPPDDVPALAQAIDRLLSLSPESRRQRGEIGMAVAEQYFEINQVIPQWYAIYGTVTGNDLR